MRNPSSHVCYLRRTLHVVFACTGMAQGIPRGTCHCTTMPARNRIVVATLLLILLRSSAGKPTAGGNESRYRTPHFYEAPALPKKLTEMDSITVHGRTKANRTATTYCQV